MAVYVDDMRARKGRLVFSHMLADSDQELRSMAQRIGIPAKYHQYPGSPKSHFDVCQQMRARAIDLGAVPITMKQAGAIVRSRRKVKCKRIIRARKAAKSV